MHDRILGRSDDMFIIRAVNVYPSHIDQLLSGFEGVGSEYQVILNREKDGKDYMLLRLERASGHDTSADPQVKRLVQQAIKKQLLVSCDVEIVNYGGLPRSEKKTKRVFDNRD
jgi:phenylacetate-CoA ligase